MFVICERELVLELIESQSGYEGLALVTTFVDIRDPVRRDLTCTVE